MVAPKKPALSAAEKAKQRVAKLKTKMIHRKRKNNSVRPGQQFGDLEVLKRVPTPQGSSGGQRWRVLCSCGKRLSVPQFYLVRKEFPKTHCGCAGRKPMPNKRERGIFYMMHRRCYNETHVAFKHYGGANPRIGVVDAWNKDVVGNETAWANFIRDMGPAPSRGHTLDRIDPYKWYGPENCRWATATEQMNNLKRHWARPEDRAKLDDISKHESFKDAIGDEIPDNEDDEDEEGEDDATE